MQFTVKQGAAAPKPIPQTLRLLKPPIQPIATPPVRQRFLTLVEVLKPPRRVTGTSCGAAQLRLLG
jgi:hypothetical protein